MKGVFITLEGADGTGKTTQASLLFERLKSKWPAAVIKLREPGGTPECEEMRNLLKKGTLSPTAELILFNAARAELVEKIIKPAVQNGLAVVCDRFIDSTMAYQCWGNGLDEENVRAIINVAVQGCFPTVTILLELDAQEANERAAKTDGRDGIAKYDAAGEKFKERVRMGYDSEARLWPDRIQRISASGTKNEVHERIWTVVEPYLT